MMGYGLHLYVKLRTMKSEPLREVTHEMIRLLNSKNQDEVLNYLYQDTSFNIFIIGDIESFGMQTDFQRLYGEYDDLGKLQSVFLRYHDYAVYSSHELRFNVDYLNVFEKDPFKFISGKTELMDLIKPYLPNYQAKNMYFCKAEGIQIPSISDPSIQTLKTETDAGKLYDLLVSITEFGYAKTHDKTKFIKEKTSDQKMGVILFIEDHGQVVATAGTTAETTKNAMVIAVATDANHRHKGYAILLMKKLMDIYLNEKGKSLCLSYDNPDAGKIYHRLGFVTIGGWSSYGRNDI